MSTIKPPPYRFRALYLSVLIFFAVMFVIVMPVTVHLALVNPDKEVVTVGSSLIITSQDILYFFSIAAGSVALGSLLVNFFYPSLKKARRQLRKTF